LDGLIRAAQLARCAELRRMMMMMQAGWFN
jgi:hypothetical protein